MKLNNHQNMLERPFYVIYDGECSLCPTDDDERIARHEPSSQAFYLVCTHDYSKNRLWEYVGEDCVEKLLVELYNTWQECLKEMKKNVKMSLIEEQAHIYKYSQRCHICNQPFLFSKDAPISEYNVRDHCHRTGKFRGAAHEHKLFQQQDLTYNCS